MILAIYTFIHVVISLIGIFSGFVVLFGLLSGKRLEGWTKLFLITTLATSITGFGFPLHHFGAPHAIGVISLVILAIAIFARYRRHLAGPWRWIYVSSAIVAFYLNVFVGVVQSFQKVPALNALAPTQSEPPFAITQLVVLALCGSYYCRDDSVSP
jgi:hypothetical protein